MRSASQLSKRVSRADEGAAGSALRAGLSFFAALSAHAPEDERDHCIATGMDDYMMKPIDVKVLHALLRKYAPVSSVTGAAAARETASGASA